MVNTLDLLNDPSRYIVQNNLWYAWDNPSWSGPDYSGVTAINNIIADPLLLPDYHAAEGSPAIGAGVLVAGLAGDFEANCYNNPPTIGAFEVQEAGLAAINDLTARAKDGKVTLIWTPVVGADSYNIYRSTTQGGPYTQIATGHMTDYATYLDSGLSNGTTYYYVVTSVANGTESLQSNEVSARPAARARR